MAQKTEQPADITPDISQRKDAHIDLCATDEVESRQKSTLLEEVELLHDSLPELDMDAVSLDLEVFGKTLRAPLLITGMTGGAERAREINRHLASVAQELGLAMGVGSQRAMLRHPEMRDTYQVREYAPDILLFGNIGAVQAVDLTRQQAQDLVGEIDADALCIHLNPGQELIQPEGDRDFRGCLDAIARLRDELDLPIIVKETGCGLSFHTLGKIKETGVQWVDVSGAGGTTWIGVEALRTPPEQRDLGQLLWDWGVPTAVSISWAEQRGFHTIGSGGLRNALDVARALALGARMAGMALPWLRAVHNEGPEAALAYGERLVAQLRAIMTLTGSKNLDALRHAPRILGSNLERWLSAPSFPKR